MLLHMLGCCMGMGAGAVGVGDVTDRDGDVGEGDVGLAGAEVVLEPRLPDEVRPPPARAKTSSGIRKQRKKNSVRSISPLNTQRFVNITPPDFVYLVCLVCLVKKSNNQSVYLCNLGTFRRFATSRATFFLIDNILMKLTPCSY
jgi:hypothetical protein